MKTQTNHVNMQSNLAGRLRNTHLPTVSGLLPLFEAVVNSIHGIEESGIDMDKGEIHVEVLRTAKQEELSLEEGKKRKGPDPHGDIIGFKISDNGIGFTNANMRSFQTLDSDHKSAKGCRGIGRLLWLKAFKDVKVESAYSENGNGTMMRRAFVFDPFKGVHNDSNVPLDGEHTRRTVVHLHDFDPKYREHSRKTIASIAECILEHCLWYFVRNGGVCKITIADQDDRVSLDDLYESHMHSSATPDQIKVKGIVFDLLHVKRKSTPQAIHSIAYCADNRLVTEEKLSGKIPGLYGKLSDENGDFIYSCYVSSVFLNKNARPQRTGFDAVENADELFDDGEVSLSEVRSSIVAKSTEHLKVYLTENLKRGKERVENFIAGKAPRYRPILSRISESNLNVDPSISDKELELTLHKHLAEIEGELLTEGHEIMSPKVGEKLDDYSKRLADYLKKANDIKMSDLANYVSHRKVILDLLSIAIKRKSDGSYAREDLLHGLIMPMQKTSDDVSLESCNLWLIDERLAFHDYLASDKTLVSMPITGSDSTKEPDICALNVFDNPLLINEGDTLPLATISIVEIKRPMRNDASSGEEADPIEQALGYLMRIRQGGTQTKSGRPIPMSESIPGFCYIIADLTPTLITRCKIHDLKPTHDKMGYFGYNSNFGAYIEVISFDRLVNIAKERNRAFFDRLGLPTN